MDANEPLHTMLNTMPDNSSRTVTQDGRTLLLVRRHGEFYLFDNRCPHTGDTLDPMGTSIVSPDGLLFTCQRHGAQFIADTGECVGGPCLGQRVEKVGFSLRNGEVVLDNASRSDPA